VRACVARAARPPGARRRALQALLDPSIARLLGEATPARVAAAVAIAGLAGVLRGFTGFGLALAAVPGLSLILPPREVVPCVLLLQVVAGFQLVPSTRHAVDWHSVGPIFVTAALATPIGTALLADLPADPMRAVIGGVLLAAVALLWRAPRFARRPSLGVRLGLGVLSGLLNGATAMAGPPVIAYFLAVATRAEVGRASLLTYFLLLSLAGVAAAVLAGLITLQTLTLAAVMLPAVVAGNAVGHRLFGRASEEAYRRAALALLAAMALLAMVRAVGG
jgi:uncharacterized membrane protein YfcA